MILASAQTSLFLLTLWACFCRLPSNCQSPSILSRTPFLLNSANVSFFCCLQLINLLQWTLDGWVGGWMDRQWMSWGYMETEFWSTRFLRAPGDSVVKNPPANAEDVGLVPGSGRPPAEGNDNPVQYSCLGNPMDRGAWWATVRGIAKSGHNLVTSD